MCTPRVSLAQGLDADVWKAQLCVYLRQSASPQMCVCHSWVDVLGAPCVSLYMHEDLRLPFLG